MQKGVSQHVFLLVWYCICWWKLSSFLVHVWWVAIGQLQSILRPSWCLVALLQTMGTLGWVFVHQYQWGRSIAWFSVVPSAFLGQCSYECACFCWVFHQHCIPVRCTGDAWLVASVAEHTILEWSSKWLQSLGAMQLHLIYVRWMKTHNCIDFCMER